MGARGQPVDLLRPVRDDDGGAAMTGERASAGYELVLSRTDPDSGLHVRAIQRRGQQDPSLCGQVKDGKPVAVDPFRTLFAQITCKRCSRVLDRLR
jgi:hypothetical protein